jgi:predicted Zn-dependent protease
MNGKRMLVWTGVLCLSVGLAGCAINPATGERQLRLISTAEEIAIGQEAAPQFEKEFDGKVPSETLQGYVRRVGAAVARASDRKEVPYEYALLASDVPNAFALPGGKVYVTAGLMRRMTNERQLAAVLGHETGHVAALHNVSALQRQMGASLLAEIAGAVLGGAKGEAAKAGAKVVAGMVNLRYSRGDEYQADMLGIRYMTEAGYSPWGMVELLARLQELSGSEPGSLGEMFQTHPLTSKRIEQARQEILSKPEYRKHSASASDPKAGQFMKMRKMLE